MGSVRDLELDIEANRHHFDCNFHHSFHKHSHKHKHKHKKRHHDPCPSSSK